MGVKLMLSAHLLKQTQIGKKRGAMIELSHFWYKFHEYSNSFRFVSHIFFLFQFIYNNHATKLMVSMLFIAFLGIKHACLKKKVFFSRIEGDLGPYEMLSKWNICSKYCLLMMLNENRFSLFFPHCKLSIASVWID